MFVLALLMKVQCHSMGVDTPKCLGGLELCGDGVGQGPCFEVLLSLQAVTEREEDMEIDVEEEEKMEIDVDEDEEMEIDVQEEMEEEMEIETEDYVEKMEIDEKDEEEAMVLG